MTGVPLEELGWDPVWAYHAAEVDEPGLVAGRLTTVDRGLVTLATANGSIAAEWRFPVPIPDAHEGVMPAVGDWGLINGDASTSRLSYLLPRRTLLARGVGKGSRVTQPLAANVDLVMVVTGLDRDFSVRRIERFLVLARSGVVRAIVVLSKSDLCSDLERAEQEARRVAPGQTVVAVSAVDGRGLSRLTTELGPGRTAVLVGSSGVGKSTLINRLLGAEHQSTGAVRASDQRGRHITTRRELLVLPNGGLIIDTPGLREVGLLASAEALVDVFPEIAALEDQCRFSDCAHEQEPDCAVLEAVDRGHLEADRLGAYQRLRREQANADRRADEHLRRAHERATVGHYKRYLREAQRLKGKGS
jgi:ribosome biogenesis GTPase